MSPPGQGKEEARDGDGAAAGARMLARLLVINEVSQVALTDPEPANIYRAVAESLVRHFSYFEASVFGVDRAAGRLVMVAQSPAHELGREPPYSQPVEAGLVGVAVRERCSVLVNDVTRDSRYVPPPNRAPCPAELCTPVLKDGEVVAVIDVESCEPGAFGESDRLALESIANMVGLALRAAEAHAELERQVEHLREARAQLLLSERLADIGRLTSRVAHEIRNPLATIGGFARRVQKNVRDNPRCFRDATIVVEEVERLERLLAGVMDFVRPGAAKKETVDVNAVVERSVALCEGSRQGKEITVLTELRPDLPRIWADPAQLEQVFINILRNAFDAIARTGTVTVASKRADDAVVVRISDTGGGILPEHLERIFDPFFTTKPGGNGLGLAVASKIVDDHDGHILIGSEPGEGTTVSIRLPVRQPPGPSPSADQVYLIRSP